MKLEQLQERLKDLEGALSQATNNVYVIQGHKQELEFQINELLKPAPEENVAAPVGETKVDQPVVNSDENTVE